VGTLLCVVIGSLLPASSAILHLVARSPLNDKGLHFSAYLVLALLPVVGFEQRRLGVVAGALMVLLGIVLEGGQSFSPGRHVELNDLVANGVGVLCGILLGLPLRS
jgi:VanZ family protein